MIIASTDRIERTLANSCFLHGMLTPVNLPSALTVILTQLRTNPRLRFDGILIDTAGNRRSVMGRPHFEADNCKLGLHVPVLASSRKSLKGIGVSGRVLGYAMIQNTFLILGLVIDVDFSALCKDSPSLFSNRDMIVIGLDILLQGSYLHAGGRQEPLSLENIFFFYRWSATGTPSALYIESELRRFLLNHQ